MEEWVAWYSGDREHSWKAVTLSRASVFFHTAMRINHPVSSLSEIKNKMGDSEQSARGHQQHLFTTQHCCQLYFWAFLDLSQIQWNESSLMAKALEHCLPCSSHDLSRAEFLHWHSHERIRGMLTRDYCNVRYIDSLILTHIYSVSFIFILKRGISIKSADFLNLHKTFSGYTAVRVMTFTQINDQQIIILSHPLGLASAKWQ